jgi:hypothetical protein
MSLTVDQDELRNQAAMYLALLPAAHRLKGLTDILAAYVEGFVRVWPEDSEEIVRANVTAYARAIVERLREIEISGGVADRRPEPN